MPRGLIRYLYVTACISGAAVMIVEILGARMLAPYVGTSHFVWTAQIAVTLAALAFGYYVGGRWVDRSAKLGRLYWALLIAGVLPSLTVALREWVAYRFLSASAPGGLASIVGVPLLHPAEPSRHDGAVRRPRR